MMNTDKPKVALNVMKIAKPDARLIEIERLSTASDQQAAASHGCRDHEGPRGSFH